MTLGNSRQHATKQRFADEHFAAKQPHLTALPVIPYSVLLTIERRVSHDGLGRRFSVVLPRGASIRFTITDCDTSKDPREDPQLRGTAMVYPPLSSGGAEHPKRAAKVFLRTGHQARDMIRGDHATPRRVSPYWTGAETRQQNPPTGADAPQGVGGRSGSVRASGSPEQGW